MNYDEFLKSLEATLRMSSEHAEAKMDLFIAMEPTFMESNEALIKYCTRDCCPLHSTIPKDDKDWDSVMLFVMNIWGHYLETSRGISVLAFAWASSKGVMPEEDKATLARTMADMEVSRLYIHHWLKLSTYHKITDAKARKDYESVYGFGASKFIERSTDIVKLGHQHMVEARKVRDNQIMEQAKHATKN